jgi:hypothetical protein
MPNVFCAAAEKSLVPFARRRPGATAVRGGLSATKSSNLGAMFGF